VIVVSPHRDDAALSVGATLAILTRQGAAVRLISCFTRSSWAPLHAGVHDQHSVTNIRAGEDVRYLRTLGRRARLFDLAFLDGPLREDWSYPTWPKPPDIPVSDGCVTAVRKRLLQYVVNPGAWLIPLGLEHPDHVIARNAALEAAGQAAVAIYEDVPYNFWVSEQDRQRSIRDVEEIVAARLRARVLHGPGELRSWYRGARCYPSQFSASQVRSMARLIQARGGEGVWVTERFDAWLTSLSQGVLA